MPSKNSQDDFQSFFKKFGNLLNTSRLTPGIIKAPKYIKDIKAKLKKLENSETLDTTYIIALAQKLEVLGEDGYGRLDPNLFSTLVETVIASKACLKGERVACQLGTSLFNDTVRLAEEEVATRKALIGESCLIQAMKYFADNKSERCVRRWIGLLCLQLLNGCKSNQDTLDMGPEKIRRQIGRMVIDEPDEILKIMAAHLICILQASGTPLEFLWPEKTDKAFYEGFPPATQDNTGWGQAFQNYVDDLYEKARGPAAIGHIFSATEMVIQPAQKFGADGHNVVLFMDDEKISAFAPSHDGTNPRILDIQLSSLVRMAIVMEINSQVWLARVALNMAVGVKGSVCVDAEPREISQITFWMEPTAFVSFETALSGLCSELNIVKPEGDQAPPSSKNHTYESQKPHTSICEILVQPKDSAAGTSKTSASFVEDLVSEPSSEASSEQDASVLNFDKNNAESPPSAQPPQPNSDEANSDIFDASPLEKKNGTVTNSTGIPFAKARTVVHKQKGFAVKPKAKMPIAPKTKRGETTTMSQKQAMKTALTKQVTDSSVPLGKPKISAASRMANRLPPSKALKNDDFDYEIPDDDDDTEPLSKPPKKRGATARTGKAKSIKERKSMPKVEDAKGQRATAAIKEAARSTRSSQRFQPQNTKNNTTKPYIEDEAEQHIGKAVEFYKEHVGDLGINGNDKAAQKLKEEANTHEIRGLQVTANARKYLEKNSRKSGIDMTLKLDSLLGDMDLDHEIIGVDGPLVMSNTLSTAPKIHIETPVEESCQELESIVLQDGNVIGKSTAMERSSSDRKRKSKEESPTSPKRQRHNESYIDDIEVNEQQGDGNMRPSSPVRALAIATKELSSTKAVSKDSNRKPALIAFSSRGPENQGPFINVQNQASNLKDLELVHVSSSKRKRGLTTTANGSPPSKRRQNSSPFAQDDNVVVIHSSPPTPNPIVQPPKPASKSSSQGSRVDHNGSPSARLSGQDDHFGKLKERLNISSAELQAGKTLTKELQLPEASQIFGPKVELSSNKGKAKPLSPMQITVRYVAHEKLDRGGYKELHTDEVIPLESEMPDPFVEKARIPTGFTQKLRYSMQEMAASSRSPGQQPSFGSIQIQEPERLVTTEQMPIRKTEKAQSSPSDVTTGTSSSQNSRKPLEERSNPNQVWNMAIRPHYATVQSAVHRIADEMIIRLSDEETQVDLVVQQYQENGSHIVQKLTTTRELERASVLKSLYAKKVDIVSTYSTAQNGVSEAEKVLKKSTTATFESRWVAHQQEVCKQIAERRSKA